MRNENFEFMQETLWTGCRQAWSEEGEHPRCILLQSRLRSNKGNKPMPDENSHHIRVWQSYPHAQENEADTNEGYGHSDNQNQKYLWGVDPISGRLLRPWRRSKEHYCLEIPGSGYNQLL